MSEREAYTTLTGEKLVRVAGPIDEATCSACKAAIGKIFTEGIKRLLPPIPEHDGENPCRCYLETVLKPERTESSTDPPAGSS